MSYPVKIVSRTSACACISHTRVYMHFGSAIHTFLYTFLSSHMVLRRVCGSELAREAMTDRGYAVLGSYLSPVNDAYGKKVREGMTHPPPHSHRLNSHYFCFVSVYAIQTTIDTYTLYLLAFHPPLPFQSRLRLYHSTFISSFLNSLAFLKFPSRLSVTGFGSC